MISNDEVDRERNWCFLTIESDESSKYSAINIGRRAGVFNITRTIAIK
jgi:hypothetical protein